MIKAMKQALAALENSIDTVRNEYENDWRHGLPTRKAQLDAIKEMVDQHDSAIKSLRWAIAEAEQEPVAWMHPDGRLWTFGKGFDKSTFTIPLYTTPPQRQPLTDEELAKVLGFGEHTTASTRITLTNIARAIEAAHGIEIII